MPSSHRTSSTKGYCRRGRIRYLGGFPLAIHYPILGWLLIAIATRLCADATHATLAVGYVFTLSVPLLTYVLCRRNGAHFLASFVVGLIATWLAPHTPFTGGLGTFAVMGLVSQVVCIPTALLWTALVLGRGSSRWACVASMSCILAHPQIASIILVLLGFAVVVTGSKIARHRFAVSAAGALVVAALVYGPGIAAMGVPFEWPALPLWMQLGFGPDRLDDWFIDGLLLDHERPAVLTSLWLASVLVLCAKLRRSPSARAAVGASILVIVLSTMGPALSEAGNLGPALLRVFQPLRSLACIPLVVFGTVLVAFEQYRGTPQRMLAVLARRLENLRFTQSVRHFPKLLVIAAVVAFATIGLALAWTLRSAHRWQIALWTEEFSHFPAERPCGSGGPSRPEMAALKAQLAKLDGGRLWYDPRPNGVLGLCAVTTGFERDSRVPIAPTSGVGAHVGLLHEANLRLTPHEPGLAERARSLGIRHVLVASPLPDDVSDGFRLVAQYGPLYLYERDGVESFFGVGCLERELEGRPRELHRQLLRLLGTTEGRRQLLDPLRLTELRLTQSSVGGTQYETSCTAGGRTHLTEIATRAGHYAAVVDTDEPITIVLRATAHRGWHVTIGGVAQTGTLTSPGYFSYAVPKGHHEIRASHRASPTVLLGFTLVPLIPLMVLLVERRRNKSAP
ncbi:MAG: hypothetical protein QM784_36615 [Polyangiaceae bacterium]